MTVELTDKGILILLHSGISIPILRGVTRAHPAKINAPAGRARLF
jgi:hypothetical protein